MSAGAIGRRVCPKEIAVEMESKRAVTVMNDISRKDAKEQSRKEKHQY